jgi:hypothetical protein
MTILAGKQCKIETLIRMDYLSTLSEAQRCFAGRFANLGTLADAMFRFTRQESKHSSRAFAHASVVNQN